MISRQLPARLRSRLLDMAADLEPWPCNTELGARRSGNGASVQFRSWRHNLSDKISIESPDLARLEFAIAHHKDYCRARASEMATRESRQKHPRWLVEAPLPLIRWLERIPHGLADRIRDNLCDMHRTLGKNLTWKANPLQFQHGSIHASIRCFIKESDGFHRPTVNFTAPGLLRLEAGSARSTLSIYRNLPQAALSGLIGQRIGRFVDFDLFAGDEKILAATEIDEGIRLDIEPRLGFLEKAPLTKLDQVVEWLGHPDRLAA